LKHLSLYVAIAERERERSVWGILGGNGKRKKSKFFSKKGERERNEGIPRSYIYIYIYSR